MLAKLYLTLIYFSLSFVGLLSYSLTEAMTADGASINQSSDIGNKSAAIDLNLLVGKGLELYNMSDYQGALTWFDRALAIDPNNSSAIINKARTYYNLDKLQEALQWFEKALVTDPNNVVALNGKASALADMGQNEEALRFYDKALAIEPNNVNALTNKGITLSIKKPLYYMIEFWRLILRI
jgi:tetratricopeptide (TPR) repeat protein